MLNFGSIKPEQLIAMVKLKAGRSKKLLKLEQLDALATTIEASGEPELLEGIKKFRELVPAEGISFVDLAAKIERLTAASEPKLADCEMCGRHSFDLNSQICSHCGYVKA